MPDPNRLLPRDRPVHDWYRFVLSFPPHLVREYLDRLGVASTDTVLDPFCGTGTTLVECKKNGIASVGLERNPMAHFASSVKVNWAVEPGALDLFADEVAGDARETLTAQRVEEWSDLPLLADNGRGGAAVPARRSPDGADGRASVALDGTHRRHNGGDAGAFPAPNGLRGLEPARTRLLLKNSISPVPLHKSLVLIDSVDRASADNGAAPLRECGRLALAAGLVRGIGNLRFGPEVGVGRRKADASVVDIWHSNVKAMADDLREVRRSDGDAVEAQVVRADARSPADVLPPNSVDAVITSPPYPNEKDYTRTTRLESVVLGMINDLGELRALKKEMVRSNTRGVYKVDDDDIAIESHPEVSDIADRIEQRRLELGKTSGFERMYGRVVKLYFGGMARHLASLRAVLRPGARLAYVVGDQASYLRVMIRTGQILARIADTLGYEVVGIDLFRTRLATATRAQLREEVVVLKWPGGRSG